VKASQKLTFLKDVDPKLVQKALAARLTDTQGVRDDVEERKPSGGDGAVASAPATRSAAGPSIFDKLSARLSDDGGIAAEVRAVIQFRLIEPESAWLVDLSEGHGAVKPGTRDGADVVFTLKDEDLEALTRGDADMRDLHQRGALRVDGDVRLAQRLSFLKGLA
jgi:3-hydroxyacyl-CoA dehydrogenase/3a,7a,12a-trihydroxy-5b-cholest-24-enoyl-CoA hydratase